MTFHRLVSAARTALHMAAMLAIVAAVIWIAVPAAKAIVEAASNPAACDGYARSDCAAVMSEGW
uniref:hypothetical protein n=1 Tax=Paracoccus sp. TRP TaxID=412597 RepID=UPI000225F43E|nr:hypothetical protein [Paracoccus sp. TRP]